MKSGSTNGSILLITLLFSMIIMIFISGLTNIAVVNIKSLKRTYGSETAFHIAEAGINYYRWRLAHDDKDFWEGTCTGPGYTNCSLGPYVHDFKNKNNTVIGKYSLEITPPATGSTKVVITSTGYTCKDGLNPPCDPGSTRISRATMAKPSYAQFAIITDENLEIPTSIETYGRVHSNGGIRFDGIAHHLVTSYLLAYDDPTHDDFGDPDPLEDGVHTHQPSPSQVFLAGKKFSPSQGINRITFTDMFKDLNYLEGKAGTPPGGATCGQSTDVNNLGFYCGPAEAGNEGYLIELRAGAPNTFHVRKVKKIHPLGNCNVSPSKLYANTGDIAQDDGYITNPQGQTSWALPPNGVLFFEDDLWVEGDTLNNGLAVSNEHITIVAGKTDVPDTENANITINDDIKYTSYDGRDGIGLIAENNINIRLGRDGTPLTNLRIDAALVAQKGRIGRYGFKANCVPTKAKLTLYGSLITKKQFRFSYFDVNGLLYSGYQTIDIRYDPNLVHTPPPEFPLVSAVEYTTLLWEEL